MSTTKRSNCLDCGKPIDYGHKRCHDCHLKYVRAQPKKSRHKTLYPCRFNCGGFTTKKGHMCMECYSKDKARYNVHVNNQSKYPCRNGCGRMTLTLGGLCRICLDAERLRLGEIKQAEKEKRIADKIKLTEQRLKPRKIEICPKRDGLGHWWELNSENYGVCKCCGKGRNFKAVQRRFNVPQIISSESYS